jgi:hypothetical protein
MILLLFLEEVMGKKLAWTQTHAHSKINKTFSPRNLRLALPIFFLWCTVWEKQGGTDGWTLATINIDLQIMHKKNS